MAISDYTSLVTLEHQDKPKFMALLAALIQPLSDLTDLINSMPGLFDLDVAVGDQLDKIGQWVGVSRGLKVPLTGVFFSFDTVGLGFDQGIWQWQYTPADGLEQLPDAQYRTLIRMRILNNNWNGSLIEAYDILNALFANSIYVPFIQDNGNLTMSVGLSGAVPDVITKALLIQGYFNVRPAGVTVIGYSVPSATGPIFAFDINNTVFAGFDQASWATQLQSA
jgi:hypothetical protein